MKKQIKKLTIIMSVLTMSVCTIPVHAQEDLLEGENFSDPAEIMEAAFPEEMVLEEIIPEGTSPEEVPAEEIYAEDVFTEDVISEDIFSEDVIPEESFEDAFEEENFANEPLTEELVTEESFPEEILWEESIQEEPEAEYPEEGTEELPVPEESCETDLPAEEPLTEGSEEMDLPLEDPAEDALALAPEAEDDDALPEELSEPETSTLSEETETKESKEDEEETSDTEESEDLDLLSAEISGQWGDLNWTLENSGKLTITGTFPMNSLSSTSAWLAYKSEIKSVVIQSGVKSIAAGAFNGCSSLTSVSIPGTVTEIGDSAFASCQNLTSLSLPKSVLAIYDNAFAYTGLTSLTLPSGLRHLGHAILNGNTGVKSLAIPKTLETIGTGYRSDYNTAVGPFYGSCVTSVTLQSGLPAILNRMFYGARYLSSVSIPGSVSSIGEYAFASCSQLTSLSIPNSVTAIYDGAFADTGLTALALPSGLRHLGHAILNGNTGVKSLTIPKTLETIGTGYRSDYNTTVGPFYGSNVTSVTLQNGLSAILSRMFYGARYLKSISIPGSVSSIGEYAFASCSQLTSLSIPNSVTAIYDCAFADTGLTALSLPSGLRHLGTGILCGNMGVKSLTIPKTLETIGTAYRSDYNTTVGPFYGSEVTSVTLQNGLPTILSRMFYGAKYLKKVSIPDSVSSIGDYAFASCSRLAKVSFGSVKNLWKTVSIGTGNDELLSVSMTYGKQSGFIKINSRWKLFESGKLRSSYTGLVKGTINGKTGWYFVKKGVFTERTGITRKADGSDAKTWYYVKNGRKSSATTIAKKIGSSGTTRYYVRNGKLNRITGTVRVNGKKYKVVNGVVKNK